MRMVLDAVSGEFKPFAISSPFHAIDSAHPDPHTGIDLAMKTGTDILSPVDGIVSQVFRLGNESIGNAVYVKLKGGSELIFGHLSRISVKAGDPITVGQKIAESGNTGHSTGPHLHMALKDGAGHFIDPDVYVQAFQKVSDAVPHKGVMDYLNGMGDWFIGKEVDFVFAPVGKFIVQKLTQLINLLNTNSVEIITLGCVGCGIMLMISSVTGGSAKWFGRLFIIFFGGVTWRILLN